jgi:TatD DNase family protein
MLIDSHAHLNFPGFEGRLEFPDVSKIVVVGTNLEDSEKAIDLARKHNNLFATVGIHPHETCGDWEKFEELAKSAVAIGECGLDYSRTKNGGQRALFQKQIGVAKKLDLPLILHVREVQEDIIEMLKRVQHDTLRGVFHCCSGDEDYLKTILGFENFYVSFAGNITYKSAQNLRDLVKLVPLEKLMVETDSPFLTPEPHRGTRNTPENVKIVAEKIASIKELSLEEVAGATTKNAETLFRI